MKILLLTQEPPLQDSEVVSGNAVRGRQLRSGLEGAGHRVVQAWLSSQRQGRAGNGGLTFRNRDDLQGILMNQQPDAILVGYWELLGLLPFESRLPVILDYVAPRSLEELYESPGTVRSSLRRLKLNLQRCDAVLVGNELQRHLLINTLIEAGFDLRGADPILVVPLGSEIAGAPRSDPGGNGWVFVSGGVTWPWRNSESFGEQLQSFMQNNQASARLVRFGGQYRWHDTADPENQPAAGGELGPVSVRALEPYRRFSQFLSENAHIGVELAEQNIEREYSQSFRSVEFLRHGLPLLCNRFLPLSEKIREFDAGWVVDEPESLQPLLADITSNPGEWKKKSNNALELVAGVLSPENTTKPLLNWLNGPGRTPRLPPDIAGREKSPVLGVPPLRDRIGRQFKLARNVMFNRLFGQEQGSGVLFVTRGDLFPSDHGAAVRTVETAKALACRGIRVGIVTESRSHWYEMTGQGPVSRKYPGWTRLTGLPGPLTKLLHFSKDLPFSNSFLYLPMTDGTFYWRTLAAARAVAAGVLQAEFPAYAKPCLKARDLLDCNVVLVEHNVEYDRIRAQVKELSEQQYENLKAIEIDLCNRADAVVCVSDNDRQKLGDDGVYPDLMHTIPHGVDLAQFDSEPAVDARQVYGIPAECPLLVYHGTFSYPPNREALRIFAEILLPGLEDKGLVCHLLAVGRNPPSSSLHPRIHLVGSVDRVGPWLKSADLSPVPLTDGGGTRMKIIDCFAAALPVISTSKGIEGIPVIHGKQALVLDDWNAFMAAVIELWETPEKSSALAIAGREMAESLDWDAIAQKYQTLYNTLA
jgi:glycosyltransferase involved in cell wall biosynthesis